MDMKFQIINTIGIYLGALATFVASLVSLYIAIWSKGEKFKGNIEIYFYTKDISKVLSCGSSNTSTNVIATITFNINNIKKTNSIINFNEFYILRKQINKTTNNKDGYDKSIFFLYMEEKKIKAINKLKLPIYLNSNNIDLCDLIKSKFGYLYTEQLTEIKLPIKIAFEDFEELVKNKLEVLEKELKEYENYKPLNKDDKVKCININNCVHTYNFLYTIIKKNTLIDVSKYKRIYVDFKLPIDDKKNLDIYNKMKEFKEFLNDYYYKKN